MTDPTAEGRGADADGAPEELPPLVDFVRMGNRLRKTVVVVAVLVVVGWGVSIPFLGAEVGTLMNLMGLGLAVLFVAEVVIVGGSAVSGLLRAGERGDRLAGSDVSLLPPQLQRRRDPDR